MTLATVELGYINAIWKRSRLIRSGQLPILRARWWISPDGIGYHSVTDVGHSYRWRRTDLFNFYDYTPLVCNLLAGEFFPI
jgi:hypothetical protein